MKFGSLLIAGILAAACSSKPKGPFTESEFAKNKKEYIENYTDISKSGILTESKKVIVPDFKVYFQTQAKGAATTGHALTTNDSRVSGKLQLAVDQKILQELTDMAYEKFVADMKALGYEVIDPMKLAELSPEFKEYWESDSMKASPQNVDDQYLAYAPTGWKLEQPGVELGLNKWGMFKGAFGANLQKISAKITDDKEMIRMQPVLIVSFGGIVGHKGYSSATIEAYQNLTVLPQSKYNFTEDYSAGNVVLEKPLESNSEYGKIVKADSAGDTAKGYLSALSYALGGSQNNSHTWVVEADQEKFKSTAWTVMKSVQEMFKDKMKEEM